jgi:hypothetical protein
MCEVLGSIPSTKGGKNITIPEKKEIMYLTT